MMRNLYEEDVDYEEVIRKWTLPTDGTTSELLVEYIDCIWHGLPVPVDLESELLAEGIDTYKLMLTIEGVKEDEETDE